MRPVEYFDQTTDTRYALIEGELFIYNENICKWEMFDWATVEGNDMQHLYCLRIFDKLVTEERRILEGRSYYIC